MGSCKLSPVPLAYSLYLASPFCVVNFSTPKHFCVLKLYFHRRYTLIHLLDNKSLATLPEAKTDIYRLEVNYIKHFTTNKTIDYNHDDGESLKIAMKTPYN